MRNNNEIVCPFLTGPFMGLKAQSHAHQRDFNTKIKLALDLLAFVDGISLYRDGGWIAWQVCISMIMWRALAPIWGPADSREGHIPPKMVRVLSLIHI